MSRQHNALLVMTLKPHPYSLDLECPVPWPSQDGTVNQEYPFHCISEESPHDFLVRRYLETLWLPDSIMPLRQLVTSLRRFTISPSLPQTLHEALSLLLLSVRAIHDKYHNQLPRILQDGGGAGEIEEKMMWYSWNRANFRSGENGEDVEKKAWMEKLERREVQIQILLYFHILSVPSPSPTPRASSPPKKRRKPIHGPPSPIKHAFPPTASVEATTVNLPPSFLGPSTIGIDETLGMDDRLEFLMDRLSLWQLMDSLTPSGSAYSTSSQTKAKEQRDWMQIFCEDVVEQLFRDQVPQMCDLLRTKVFPHRLFSESSDNAPSPPPIRPTKTKGTRPPSPLRLQELEKPQAARSRAGSVQPSLTPADSRDSDVLQRHRSRSRSVSVSVEEVRERGANRGGVASSKRLWKGEVEMKRTSSRGSKLFKPTLGNKQNGDVGKRARAEKSQGDVLPSEAQSRTSEPLSTSQHRDARLLAEDTPVKKRLIKEEDPMPAIIMDSPDQLLLRCNRQWHDLDENDAEADEEGVPLPPTPIFAADTPEKKYMYR